MVFTEVPLVSRSIDRWRDILSAEQWDGLEQAVRLGRSMWQRPFWSINSTAVGGGVAETLRSLLSYISGVGLDAHWGVISGDDEFFRITKRLHNFIHGNPGDGGELGWQERNAYQRTMFANISEITQKVPSGSLVVLHDPQTAGLVEPLQRHGCVVVWHCHIGTEHTNEYTESAWAFLEPFVSDAHRLVFDRALHVPQPLTSGPIAIVSPSIDPFAPKNQPLDKARVHAVLFASGLLRVSNGTDALPVFYRLNGETARVNTRAVFLGGSNAPDPIHPLVLQVSRWDRLKDHLGVMRGFVHRTLPDTDAELMLVGPHVQGVPDDPEGAEVLEALVAEHAALPDAERERVHIVSLSVSDLEESDVIVNALQRHAAVVVQKSLEEGFGLTVTEALWKGKPVIASSVGGICDQITHEKSGILLEDPTDLDTFGETLTELLLSDGQGQELGTAAQKFVHQNFLHDQHIRRYLELFASIGDGI